MSDEQRRIVADLFSRIDEFSGPCPAEELLGAKEFEAIRDLKVRLDDERGQIGNEAAGAFINFCLDVVVV